MSFLNAGLAGFIGLISIPIIIYLINRQRYQRVPWAAMEFLLRAMRKNRKRLRLENLLLLILRTLIILLFVLGMMRPYLESNPLVGLGSHSRAELIVIDRSFSMGLKEGQRSLLVLAAEGVKDRINALAQGDRLGLLLGGGNPERLLPEPRYITDRDAGGASDLLSQLEGIELAYQPLEVAFTLQDAAEWIREKGGEGGWSIHFYTDLQKRDWVVDGGGDATVTEALDRLREMEVPLVVHPVGKEKPRNATVVKLESRDRLLAVDLSTAFQVTVANRSTEPLERLEVELWVDEKVQGSRTISLDPGATRVVGFPYVFRQPGLVRLKAVLLSDALEEDNSYYGVAEVREAVNVLIAEGGYREGTDEATWLEAAIGMGPGVETGIRLTPYETQVIPADRLGSVDFEDVDVLVLANLRTFAPGDAKRIEDFLRDGGGVLAFVGDGIDVGRYTADQYRGGEGWFPYAPLRTQVDRTRETIHHWIISRPGHPVLAYLAQEESAGMGFVLIHGFTTPRPGLPESSVLVTLDNAAKTPIIVEKTFGSGNVLAVGIRPDRSDSNFPITPAYVCFLHEALPYLAARADVPRNLGIGESYSRIVSAQEYATRVLLIRPEGDGVPLNLVARDDQRSFLLSTPAQEKPGNYEIRFGVESRDDVARKDFFSVNADPAEGDLTRILPEEIRDAYPTAGDYFVVKDVAAVERTGAALPPQRSGEVWRNLFWVVLIFLGMETVLARYFGRQRVRTTG